MAMWRRTNIMICLMGIICYSIITKNTAGMEDIQRDIVFCEKIFELCDMCCSKILNSYYIDVAIWHNR